MLLLVWSTDSGDSTMSLKLWRRYIGCASQSVSHSNKQSRSTEFYTVTPQTTSDRSLGCPTFQVDHHCVLHHLIIYSSRQFVTWLLVQGRCWCVGQLFGTVTRLTLRHRQSVSLSSSSQKLFVLALVSRCRSITVFLFLLWSGSFYIARSHANLIGKYNCHHNYWTNLSHIRLSTERIILIYVRVLNESL